MSPESAHIIISGSHDGTVKAWDLTTGTELRTITGHRSPTNGCAVAVTPDGIHIVAASHDDTLKVWDLATGIEVAELPLAGVQCVAGHPSEPLVACGDVSGNVMVIELVGL